MLSSLGVNIMADSFLRQSEKLNHIFSRKDDMRTKVITCSLVALLGFQSVSGKETPSQDYKHTFSVGLESFHYHYDETIDKKKFMDIKGLEFGLNGAYQLTYQDSFFVRPEGRVTYGFTEYSQPNDPLGNQPHAPDFLFETRFLTGWQFHPSQSIMIVPYAGVAYRQKENDRSQVKGKDNLGGRKRINKLWYVPLGFRGQYDFNHHWFVQAMVEYDRMLKGEQLSYDTDRYPSPLVFKQNEGYGLKGELLAGYHFDKVSVSAGPYAYYWNIEKTAEVKFKTKRERLTFDGTAYEPKNSTKEIGFKVNVTF
jgi:hypothetical protein